MKVQKKTNPLVEIQLAEMGQISLSIAIGNAQIGGNQVKFIDSDQIFHKGDVNNLALGEADSLRGRTLEIITNVLDINPGTNNIIVTDYFSGGSPGQIVTTDAVSNSGDICSITATYRFK
jgi:hypothetical protein